MPELQRKLGRTASLLLILAAVFAGAAGGCDRETAPRNVLNRSVGPEPESLDVHAANTTQSAIVLRDLGEGLTGYSAGGELVAAAAERWEVSDDGLQYRFWLRPEARWSNGERVLAEHFVYSLRRLVNPETASPYSQHLIDIDNVANIVSRALLPESLGVEAVGEFELLITLERPVPYFLSLLTHNSTFPVFPPSVEEHGTKFARPGSLISNGAYKLDDWEIGSVVSISRNEFYWNNAATAIDRVRHIVTPEPSDGLNRYRAGELDITDSVPSDAFASLQQQRPDELRVAPKIDVYYYGFNLTKPPFKDKLKLRQALSMAIDREIIAEIVTGRGELPAYGWVPPGIGNYRPMRFSYAKQTAEERHATARRLYEEAGYGEDNPLQVQLRYNTSDTHQEIAAAVQAMWKNVLGFEASLINVQFQVLVQQMMARDVTQVFRSSWGGDYNDAHSFLSIMQTGNPSNLPGYSSKKFDSLMTQAANQMDMTNRRFFLEEAEAELLADHPVIPLYFYVSKHLVSPRVLGWQDNVLDYHYSQHLTLKPDTE